MVFAAFPRSGPPPRFRDYADYAEVVGQLERTGCIADYTHIWWDIRLHPRLGTVEIRICDAVTRVEDAAALAAFCQALVKLLLRAVRARRGDPVVPPDPDGREQVARRPLRPRGAGDGPRTPAAATASRSRSSSGGRCATSSRMRASSAPSASSRGSARSSRAATAPTASCASTTRTATSSRSCERSQRRPRPSRPPPPSLLPCWLVRSALARASAARW